jgi:hypothetical protein
MNFEFWIFDFRFWIDGENTWDKHFGPILRFSIRQSKIENPKSKMNLGGEPWHFAP